MYLMSVCCVTAFISHMHVQIINQQAEIEFSSVEVQILIEIHRHMKTITSCKQ